VHSSELSASIRGGPGADALPDLSRSIELVRLVQAGDRKACDELFERYRPRLLRIVRVRLGKRLRRRLDEEDVVQEVLLVAAAKIGEFELRSHAGILHWLARIAENAIRRKREHYEADKRDAQREVRLRHGASETGPGVQVAADELSPSQGAMRAEFEELIDAYVEELEPPEYREVILLRDYCHEEWEDVRRALARPTVAAAQELYRRAHQRLRERMQRHLGGD
jgi:RNA polymerase sigma-70 factor (ECF subfamily)